MTDYPQPVATATAKDGKTCGCCGGYTEAGQQITKWVPFCHPAHAAQGPTSQFGNGQGTWLGPDCNRRLWASIRADQRRRKAGKPDTPEVDQSWQCAACGQTKLRAGDQDTRQVCGPCYLATMDHKVDVTPDQPADAVGDEQGRLF